MEVKGIEVWSAGSPDMGDKGHIRRRFAKYRHNDTTIPVWFIKQVMRRDEAFYIVSRMEVWEDV